MRFLRVRTTLLLLPIAAAAALQLVAAPHASADVIGVCDCSAFEAICDAQSDQASCSAAGCVWQNHYQMCTINQCPAGCVITNPSQCGVPGATIHSEDNPNVDCDGGGGGGGGGGGICGDGICGNRSFENCFTCSDDCGECSCDNEPTILSFTAAPMTTPAGGAVVLSWTTLSATTTILSDGSSQSTVANNGSTTVNPMVTTTYTLTVRRGPGCTMPTRSVTVIVTNTPPPTCTISAAPNPTTGPGAATTLTWSSTDATSCAPLAGTSGNATVNPATTTTYNLTCNGPGGTAHCSTTVIVGSGPNTSIFPTFQRMGAVCVDTAVPQHAAAGLEDVQVLTPSIGGADRGARGVFMSANATVEILVRFRENALCGKSRVRLRLTGDATYELETNGSAAPTIITPTPSLIYDSQVAPITNYMGISTMMIRLRGAGANTVRFTSITATVTDAAGNALALNPSAKGLTVDPIAPSCAILTPTENMLTGPGDYPINPINVQTHDDVDGSGKGAGLQMPFSSDNDMVITFSLDGTVVHTKTTRWTVPNPNDPSMPALVPLNSNGVPDPGLFNSFTVTVTDGVGNECVSTRNLLLDNVRPRLVRVLPVSRGFVTDEVDTLTLEFFDVDLSAGDNQNKLTLCNHPAEPPTDVNGWRIALFDVTNSEWKDYPLDTEALAPECTDASLPFPAEPLRGDGVTVPAANAGSTSGEFYYTYLKLTKAPPAANRAPNALTRGHRYELHIRNVADASGNTQGDAQNRPLALIRVPFTFFGPSQPLRITKQVSSALGTLYTESGVQSGTGVEVERVDELEGVRMNETTNCYKLFTSDNSALDYDEIQNGTTPLDASQFLVRNELSLVAESSPSLTSGLLAPFTLSDQLPPYFQVVNLDPTCTDVGMQQTKVLVTIYNKAGVVTYSGLIDLAPTTADASATGFRNYGMNVDEPGTATNYDAGEKGRKIIIPIGACNSLGKGDLDQDDRTDTNDSSLLDAYLATGTKPAGWTADLTMGDLNADGGVDADDATAMAQYLGGTLSCLPTTSQPDPLLNVPAGGRIDAVYYTYVTGYTED